MSTSNAHEPAFPVGPEFHVDGNIPFPIGLTKREWLAGMAMQGLLADSSLCASAEEICKAAVINADALLAALAADPEAKT